MCTIGAMLPKQPKKIPGTAGKLLFHAVHRLLVVGLAGLEFILLAAAHLVLCLEFVRITHPCFGCCQVELTQHQSFLLLWLAVPSASRLALRSDKQGGDTAGAMA